VVEAMLPYFSERFQNAQSAHPGGEEAMEAVERARAQAAGLVGAEPGEVFFTSGATESNNWALKGVAAMPRRRGAHIVASQIEHFSVMHPLRTLERQGFQVTHVPVDGQGMIDPDSVRKALRPDTCLVSLVHANAEIGTIEPLAAVGAVCREAGLPLHVDAANTAGTIPVSMKDLGADLLTVSPHMFYGPKGIGALIVRRGLRLPPLMEGGTQEGGRRPGTENVPAIVGFGVAAEAAWRDLGRRTTHLSALRNRLIEGLQGMGRIRVTGHPTQRLPHHVSCLVDNLEGESILLSLVMDADIHAASGSACSSKAQQHSYVLEAMGIDATMGMGSLLFGMGIGTSADDLDALLDALPAIVGRLRALSPLG
jgi:cysteine desulfurase